MIHLSLKEIIKFTLLISSEVSTSEFSFYADFGSSELQNQINKIPIMLKNIVR